MKRRKCPDCDRPQKVCLCKWLTSVDNQIPLTVLRHKSEAGHALNTVNILEKCLSKITVLDGEVFDEIQPARNAVLIYPSDDAIAIKDFEINDSSHLILLDGSWKKTNKILYLNPWLNEIPKVSLPYQPSRYFLRKQKDMGFSSLEAACSALGTLEKSEKYKPLLACLDKMMEQQAQFIGLEKLEEHFGDRLSKISSDKCDSMAASLSDHSSPDDKLPHPKTD